MKRERVFEIVKGFRGRAKNCFTIANQVAEKALQNQYYGRKLLKRTMRSLWITRINAGAREHGLKYGDFIHGLKLSNIDLDRKALSDLAVTEPASFAEICAKARDSLMFKNGNPVWSEEGKLLSRDAIPGKNGREGKPAVVAQK